MPALPPKPLTVQIGELVARAGSLDAGTLECPEPDLVITLARRFRQPPPAVRGAISQLRAAGVLICAYQDGTEVDLLVSLRFVPKGQRSPVRPAEVRVEDPAPPLPPAPPPEQARKPEESSAPGLDAGEREAFRVLCIFADANGIGREFPSVVLQQCIRISGTDGVRILTKLESTGYLKRWVSPGYRVDTRLRTALFPLLPPYDPERGPGIEPPSPRVISNSLTIADVGELDLVCRRFLVILRRAAPTGYNTVLYYRVVLRTGCWRLYRESISDRQINAHSQHLVASRLLKPHQCGFEVNLSVSIEGDDV